MKKNRHQFPPEKTVILWDLHEVLLEKSLWRWIILCLTYNRKIELLRKLDKNIVRILLVFILERIQLKKKELVSEELLNAARAADNQALVDLVTTVCSTYTAIEPSVAILKQLSARGYTHHLGSNIGETVFKKCNDTLSDIFSSFSASTIPFYINNKIIKKPNPHFFITHLEKNNLTPEQVIFIDDKKMNTVIAQSLGITAIQFINAAQLEKDLINLGLL